MSFLTMYLNQTLTWWRNTGTDGFGDSTYAAPQYLPCRWEDRSTLITNAEGAQVPSRARAWLDRDVKIGDWLMLGKSTGSDPNHIDAAYIVQDFRKVPSLDATDFERIAVM